ncbi:MAG: chemotaxis protein [Rhodobacteraceae bacterium PARR1]|nr:MAG: chemotaxis protein [Rhodobacteraceae bacterium PARR1]
MTEWTDETDRVLAEAEAARFTTRVDEMAAAHAAGNTDHMAESGDMSERYVRVMTSVNEMVFSHIEIEQKIISCVSEYAEGNFDATLDRFPGKLGFINVGVDSVRDNFRRVVADMDRMARTLVEGDFERSIGNTQFKGEFVSLFNAMDSVRSGLARVTAEVERLSTAMVQGELDAQVDVSAYRGGYRRIFEAFDAAFDGLNGAFARMGSQIQQVSITVEQMSQSSQSLATNSQIQSSSVDEISSSAEQTDTQVKSNAAAATTASQLVTGASEVAEGGKIKINEMVTAMEGIRASSQDIAKIIKVIDEIAFQTNLLALNAAVEAARAGQHGRGFAVVAQEVRNLAGRSAKAARETSDLIEDASTRVQAGVKIADETSRAFVSIADDITKVKTLVSDIATASGEQSRGVAQINVAIGEVAKSALSTSQQAEELAASAAEMQATTESMLTEVGRYRLRRRAQPATVSVPGLNLDGLPADLMAQIQAMISRQMTPPAGGTVSRTDRDSRGYANF